MNFSAVILAGGKSSRMGRDKAFLETGGQTLLARQIELARDAGAVEIFISGRADADYSASGCCVLLDRFPNAGPLAGIERALDASISPLLLVLAVDLPGMNAEFLRTLAAGSREALGAIPRMNGKIEPLAAFYPKSVQPLAETLLHAKHNAVMFFADRCVQSGLARFAELPASAAKYFLNWNFPTDLAAAATKRSFLA
jgi:molybdopterin-guanine dinucleotide biosynthesis protein A